MHWRVEDLFFSFILQIRLIFCFFLDQMGDPLLSVPVFFKNLVHVFYLPKSPSALFIYQIGPCAFFGLARLVSGHFLLGLAHSVISFFACFFCCWTKAHFFLSVFL